MIRTLKLATAAAALLALAACGDGGSGGGSSARSGIWSAGSSTVFPFATRVAENFARTAGGAAPRVESL
ncbi:MAG: phosphate ABC transporter substrate-binding protein, partial [Brevundimonas mediterranea]